jgi:oligopeptide/dipeptide ABC transporter ATP-binding protein
MAVEMKMSEPESVAVPVQNHPAIEARELKTYFPVKQGLFSALFRLDRSWIKALDGVDLQVRRREMFGLVGESGCGKSTLGMTLVRMYEPTMGSISSEGWDISHIHGRDLKRYHREAQMIFQDPYGSLNPRMTVLQLVSEPLQIHRICKGQERIGLVRESLDRVRIPGDEFLDRYPHELSGGQRQRVAIARAIVLRPQFIVADEPVSMLDVSIRAGILELLAALSNELGLAVVYISHDIATVRYICDRVAVMYLGVFVETGTATQITENPLHPYTERLMAAVPVADPTVRRERVELPGDVPSALDIPSGCRFRTRCSKAFDVCSIEQPALTEIEPGHCVACHLFPR